MNDEIMIQDPFRSGREVKLSIRDHAYMVLEFEGLVFLAVKLPSKETCVFPLSPELAVQIGDELLAGAESARRVGGIIAKAIKAEVLPGGEIRPVSEQDEKGES